MSFFRRMWRMSLFLLWMWPFAIYSLFRSLGGRAGIKRVAYCTKSWGGFLVRTFGVEVEFICNHPIEEGMLIVSNHQSYIDVLLHASLFPIRFTPKKRSNTGRFWDFTWGSAARCGWTEKTFRNRRQWFPRSIAHFPKGFPCWSIRKVQPPTANTVCCHLNLPVLPLLREPTSRSSR